MYDNTAAPLPQSFIFTNLTYFFLICQSFTWFFVFYESLQLIICATQDTAALVIIHFDIIETKHTPVIWAYATVMLSKAHKMMFKSDFKTLKSVYGTLQVWKWN